MKKPYLVCLALSYLVGCIIGSACSRTSLVVEPTKDVDDVVELPTSDTGTSLPGSPTP